MININQEFLRSIFVPGNFKIGPEAKECIKFSNACKAWGIQGQLKATWAHIPNENSNNKHKGFGMVQKAMGKIPGAPDYVFVGPEGSGWIEFKSEIGKLSPSQKNFQEWCKSMGANYEMVRSVEEAEHVLKTWNLLNF